MYLMEETKRVNIEIDIKDIPFPIGIGDEINVVDFVKAGIVKRIEFLD